MRLIKTLCLVSVLALGTVKAQSPAPITVQAASAAPAASRMSAPVASVTSISEAVKMLEQVKSANDEVLAKQKAALERLDELQEAAEQLRIFAKRG
jgi:cell shape-determining protein MreC